MFIWLEVRLCLLYAVTVVSEAEISSHVLVSVTLVVFEFSYRVLN